MDTTSIALKNSETGESERREINCLVVIEYRVKILIPEQEIWFDEKTRRPSHVLRSMAGATIDYVITAIDREGERRIASRREALNIRRRSFLPFRPEEGQKVKTGILRIRTLRFPPFPKMGIPFRSVPGLRENILTFSVYRPLIMP